MTRQHQDKTKMAQTGPNFAAQIIAVWIQSLQNSSFQRQTWSQTNISFNSSVFYGLTDGVT